MEESANSTLDDVEALLDKNTQQKERHAKMKPQTSLMWIKYWRNSDFNPVVIQNPVVVSKSCPGFGADLDFVKACLPESPFDNADIAVSQTMDPGLKADLWV